MRLSYFVTQISVTHPLRVFGYQNFYLYSWLHVICSNWCWSNTYLYILYLHQKYEREGWEALWDHTTWLRVPIWWDISSRIVHLWSYSNILGVNVHYYLWLRQLGVHIWEDGFLLSPLTRVLKWYINQGEYQFYYQNIWLPQAPHESTDHLLHHITWGSGRVWPIYLLFGVTPWWCVRASTCNYRSKVQYCQVFHLCLCGYFLWYWN